MNEHETEIEVAGYGVDAVVEYELDDIATGDRVTGRAAVVRSVYLIDGDGERVDITGCLPGHVLDQLAPEVDASPATMRRWARNRAAALCGVP